MAKAGHVYHWKHGWIPLDRAALLNKQGKGPRPTGRSKGGALTNADRRTITNMVRRKNGDAPLNPRGRVPASQPNPVGKDYRSMSSAEKIKAAEIMYGKGSARANLVAARENAAPPKTAAQQRADRYRQLDTVDGVDFVTYKSSDFDPLGTDHGTPHQFTPEQQKVLATAYNKVKAQFPGMEPIQIVGVDAPRGTFGITSWDGRRISMGAAVFTPEGRDMAARAYGEHGSIAGQHVGSAKAFSSAVLTHEMGHALQMQNGQSRAAAASIAKERVTAADLGIPRPQASTPGADQYDTATAWRWQVDTLGNQSAYGTGNEYEWVAEAFADGFQNGDKATPQSKRVLSAMHEIYGGA